jgi:ribosome biogenesis GTPase / thiamine phosphate phosphatase
MNKYINLLATFASAKIQFSSDPLNKGIVIKTTGSWHTVKDGDDQISCRLKGNFRMRGIKTTNPIAVGDVVIYEKTGTHAGIITKILERKNYIIRRATNLAKETQIMAANIDQVLLMITLESPETPLEFVDRFLVSAEAYRIPSILVINKTDLYQAEKMERCGEIRRIYEFAGYRVIEMSVEKQMNITELSVQLTGKYTAIAGNSGVGKTSLINLLCPGLNLKTAPISTYHLSGKHTTTYPEMLSLPSGGYIIDTPGIRGFGVMDINRNEIGLYFTDIFNLSANCRFYNCSHIHEPGCAVIDACARGVLHESRYRSYVKLISGGDGKYRIA